MKKTRLVLFFCLIFTIISIIPNAVFASTNDLFDDINDMFLSQKHTCKEQQVVLGGIPIGISLNNNCVEIVGFSQIITENGACSPASDAGLQIGDKITEINGKKINKTQDITIAVQEQTQLDFTFLRNEKENTAKVVAQKDVLSGKYKLGMWIRDQSYGIGTLTFVKDGKYFASLGHPITSKNGEIMQITGGKVHDCNILGVNKGLVGKAGELKGAFNNKQSIGDISINSNFGVYGTFDKVPQSLDINNVVSTANINEVKPGKAQIYSTINGSVPQYYEIEIIKVKNQAENHEKGLVIKVTDKNLLAQTGGIVQGMSGSPILQNGKLVGAVTHVFINDPTKGYGVFIDNMLEMIK